MTLDIEAVQAGLVTAAKTISGLNGSPSIEDAITPPYVAVVDIDFEYNMTFATSRAKASGAGLMEMVFNLGVYVSRGNTKEGRKLLAGYLKPNGDTSIPAAIHFDKTLGGACQACIVEALHGGYRLYQIGGYDYLGAIFDVRVWG